VDCYYYRTQWEQMQQSSGQILQCNPGNFSVHLHLICILCNTVVIIVKDIVQCEISKLQMPYVGSSVCIENKNVNSHFLNVLNAVICESIQRLR